jgi:transcriptional regulator with XRE-family HTH domain
MPMTALTGSRLRERRLALGLRQGQVASAAGISASYLNLMEHNRRAVGGDVLARLAVVLQTDADALAGAAEGAVIDALRHAAGGIEAAETGQAAEFLARFPGWAAALIAQEGRATALQQAVAALNDRITHDPHLSAAVHEVLSATTAVQATAAILAETEDIDPILRRRFHGNLVQAAGQLALGAEALVGFLAGSDVQPMLSPQDEAEAWLAARGWHLDAVEDHEGLSVAAGVMVRAMQAQHARDVACLPSAAFGVALAQLGPDPVGLAQAFGADVMAACRRIALWPGSAVGLVMCDGAGALTFRKPVPGFALPRQGAACALWPLFTALARPLQGVEILAEVPTSPPQRFVLRAFCQPVMPAAFGAPELRQAAMLILPGVAGRAVPIGPTCRICPRGACAGRREPSLLAGTV